MSVNVHDLKYLYPCVAQSIVEYTIFVYDFGYRCESMTWLKELIVMIRTVAIETVP